MLLIIQFDITDVSRQIIRNWSTRKTFELIEKEGTSVGPDEFFNWELIESLVQHSEIYNSAKIYWFIRKSLSDESDKVCLVKTRAGQTSPNEGDFVIPIVEGRQNGKAFFEMPDGELESVLLSVDWEHLPNYN